ncbi:hypothetical protein BaRGS_00024277 [Batillaria attramentaria]|uniref:Sorbitol dehydrogenase n=1 Tax=Batillaria attramentaria TaxID=370345 RepID=A0ABD0KC24_9CAEN
MGDNLCAVFYGRGDLRMENRPLRQPAEREVQISVRNCGLCMTDVHILEDGRIAQFDITSPSVPGHEMSGVITSLGASVTGFKPGDRVTSDVPKTCGYCNSCKRGRLSLCQNVGYLGIPTMDGGLGRHVNIPARMLYRLPEGVDFEDGAVTEPLSVTVNAVNRAGIGLGDTVLVFGAGPIGLLALQVARAKGATTVCVADINSDRLKLASELGASRTVLTASSETDAQAYAQKLVDMVGEVDAVLECSGAQLCLQAAVHAVRPGGCVALVGFGPENMVIPHTTAIAKEVDIRGCVANHYCFPAALKLMETGKVKVKPIISHRFSLDEVPQALEVVRKRQGLKVMINCAQTAA